MTTAVKVIKRRANTNVDAGYSKPMATQSVDTPVVEKHKFLSVAEKVAQSDVCVLNWMFPGAREAFPLEPKMRSVRRYYPYAKGGPLLIDEPQRLDEEQACQRKADVLARQGFRYLILKSGMTEVDAIFELERKIN
jgi:hypothetical protein